MVKGYGERKQIWEGPICYCAECGEQTFVRIASTLGKFPQKRAELTHAQQAKLYGPIVRKMRNVGGTFAVKCTAIPHNHMHVKMYYADLGGERYAGPYCRDCLMSYLRNAEAQDGSQRENIIFIINTSHRSLSQIRHTVSMDKVPAYKKDEDWNNQLF